MIKTFRNKNTEDIYRGGKGKKFPSFLLKIARRKLDAINWSVSLEDLKAPPGNRLEKLSGDRSGQHSIRINDQYRICFVFIKSDAYDVEIVDYH